MYCEWPVFQRCCLCLPLRRGVLVFGYINVILTILQIAILYMIEVDDLIVTPLRNIYFQMPVIFSTAICVLEIVFTVVLIYGTHTKRLSCIKIYYYFTITMLLASIILEFLSVAMSNNNGPWIIYFMFCLIINVYILFMVGSLICKLRVSERHKFSNQLSDLVVGAPAVHDRIYTDIVVPKDTV